MTREYANSATEKGSWPQNGQADPRIRQILGGLERGGALGASDDLPPSAVRRPPKLDIDAVRDAESRASLTSLPDLIKRATRLASNLDKGRTASRLGMLEMFNSSDPNLLAKVNAARDQQRNSSLSGMLSSFPAPAATPTGERRENHWPSPYENSNRELGTPMSPMKPEHKPRSGRRCCGMPCWAFILVLILLVVVIAAAVVIPVVLIVVPRLNHAANAVDLSKCNTNNPCSNGGTSVVSADSCQCVCSNGFTGSSCQQANDGSCITTNTGSVKAASMGDSLGRFLNSTATTFQIPLNATSILASFAASNVSCSSENTLIDFGSSPRRRAAEAASSSAPTPLVEAREPVPQALTTNGVVLASTASTFPTAATVSSTAAPTPTPTSSTISPSSTDVDFARVAVLFVLQDTKDLNAASSAQSTLKTRLSTPSYQSVDVGSGIVVDLTKHEITVNGTKVGG